MTTNTIKLENEKDAEAYANLMRQLPNNLEEVDHEDKEVYESVAGIQDLLAEIKSTPE